MRDQPKKEIVDQTISRHENWNIVFTSSWLAAQQPPHGENDCVAADETAAQMGRQTTSEPHRQNRFGDNKPASGF
jgi:hypothetical protein